MAKASDKFIIETLINVLSWHAWLLGNNFFFNVGNCGSTKINDFLDETIKERVCN